ncbi:MAG: hypothetical protein M3032_04350 [Verrucomicrobiota bacterium]|nr:hypothetical protein [Verrucomicrobiota bacterium]
MPPLRATRSLQPPFRALISNKASLLSGKRSSFTCKRALFTYLPALLPCRDALLIYIRPVQVDKELRLTYGSSLFTYKKPLLDDRGALLADIERLLVYMGRPLFTYFVFLLTNKASL